MVNYFGSYVESFKEQIIGDCSNHYLAGIQVELGIPPALFGLMALAFGQSRGN